mgnify:CR=1 FL=1
MNAKIMGIIMLVGALIITGCQQAPQDNETMPISFIDINVSTNETSKLDKEPVEEIDESKASLRIDAVEGDLVRIPVQAVDPDGDFLTYKFEKPFNERGIWQSKIGDEGKYLIKVTVSDGKLSVVDYVLVNLARANRPPAIECPDSIRVQETETVVIDCNIFDVDGDTVLTGYDGWMRTSRYTTQYGDAGEYTVVVRAKDKEAESFQEVKVIVTKKNRAPVIEEMSPITAMETDTIKLTPKVSDPDGDNITLIYSKPFNRNGEWETTFGDAGTYDVTVTASDGKDKTETKVKVTVQRKNRPPVLRPIADIEVEEGDTVRIPVNAFDPDGDDVIISYSGWMDSAEYTTTYNDAYPNGCNEKGCTATYTVTVRVSDGVLSTAQDVKISVKDKNRPPQFIYN